MQQVGNVPVSRAEPSGSRVQSGFRDHDPRIRYHVKGSPVQNFGDYLPELLAKEFFLHPRVEADIYRLIGSVIEPSWILRDLRHTVGVESGRVAFWCCGMRDATPLPARVFSLCEFFGVRGPRTRDALGLPADTVLGDPGLLAPLFHEPKVSAETAGRIVCIPHVHDKKSNDELLAMSKAELVVHPEVAATEVALRDILDKIASAKFVLTASLHGAIIACAYGRPFAYWDNGHLDVPFKWQDFSESVGIGCQFAKDAAEGLALYEKTIAPNLRIPPLTPILDVCPFFVRPSVFVRSLGLDGALAESDVERVAPALERLSSTQHSTVYRLQDASAQYRAEHHNLLRAASRHLGSTKEAVKLLIRKTFNIA